MNSDKRQSVVEYLLGELPADKADNFEAELLLDAGLRAEVDRLRPVVSRLESQPADAWEGVEPPPLDIAAIVSADAPVASDLGATVVAGDEGADTNSADGGLAGQPGAGQAVPASKPPRPSFAERLGFRWPSVVAAAFSALLILAVGIGVGTQLGGDSASPSGEPVQTLALGTIGDEVPPDASGEVVLTSGSDDQATLDVSGLEANGEREFYELWLLGDDGELVALGSFKVEDGGSSQIEVPLPVDPETYRYFDVSIQPENGSPDHSGRSVLRGLTAS
jgi:anti-sigma-K factor RskA